MRDENGELNVPQFRSEIPEHLIASLSPKEKWQYEQISIQGKQNEWLITRSVKADRRQNETDAKIENMDVRIKVFEDLKKVMTAKWSVIAGIGAVIAVVAPLLASVISWIKSVFKH